MVNGEVLLENVSKRYLLNRRRSLHLKGTLLGALRGERAVKEEFWALKDVSLNLKPGEALGVMGRNGSGKSTLLKVLSKILEPDGGRVEITGKIASLVELGAGFHPDFSGRDNLYFAGSLIGIDQAEMRKLEPEIIAFSELHDAIDRPVKTYSSGMNVRLAFALVTAVQPDVLIVDEALAVGDQSFQKKCIDRILDFRQKGCTILFCSHSPYHIRHLCDAALWLEKGRVQMFGETEAVLAAYDVRTRALQEEKDRLQWGDDAHGDVVPAAALTTGAIASTANLPYAVAAPDTKQVRPEGGACILSAAISDLSTDMPPMLESQDLVVTIKVRGNGSEVPNVGFMIEQKNGVGITCIGTHEEGAQPVLQSDGSWQTVLSFPDLPLHSGDYVVSAYLFDSSGLAVYDYWFQYQTFRFVYPKPLPGLVRLPHAWN